MEGTPPGVSNGGEGLRVCFLVVNNFCIQVYMDFFNISDRKAAEEMMLETPLKAEDDTDVGLVDCRGPIASASH